MAARRLVPLSLALVTVLAVGCSTGSDDPDDSAATSPTPATTSATTPDGGADEPATSGKDVPTRSTSSAADVPDTLDFEATSVDGASFEGASLAGKPVIFWFWAPWCPVCKSQIPQVEDVAGKYAGEITVVGVGSLDDESAIDDFAADVDGVTMLQDPDGAVWKHFGVTEQSSFVILDSAGNEVDRTSYAESVDLGSEVDGLTR